MTIIGPIGTRRRGLLDDWYSLSVRPVCVLSIRSHFGQPLRLSGIVCQVASSSVGIYSYETVHDLKLKRRCGFERTSGSSPFAFMFGGAISIRSNGGVVVVTVGGKYSKDMPRRGKWR
jgi:hypothetical protein